MSMSDIIDFLLDLMTDDKVERDFETDPDGTLAARGLSDVSAQDVRDARLVMADEGTARPRHDSGSGSSGGGSDPIREIRHTTNTFEIDQSRTDINQTVLDLDIDDRDTTVVDSFNGDTNTDVVAIQDNDVTNDITNNDLDVVNIEDSFNEEPTEELPESPDSPDESTVDAPVEEPEVSIQPVDEPIASIDPVEDVPADAGFDSEFDTEPALG